MSIRVRSSGNEGDLGSTASADHDRLRPSWLGRLRSRISVALGLKADPAGFVLKGRPDGKEVGQDVLIGRLATRKRPDQLRSLLDEAVALLDPTDHLVIAARLSGDGASAVADRIGVGIDEVGPLYARVVDRLVDRLAWIVSEEARGTSPPERKVLGQARFFGRSAQEIAGLLSLPEEVVGIWLREAGPPGRLEPRAPR